MQNTAVFLLCVVAASHSFFLTNKDIKKILQYFPKAFDPEPQRSSPLHYRRREGDYHYHQQQAYRPEYIPDFYDRNDDSGANRRNIGRYPKAEKTGRLHNDKTRAPHYHSHEDCDHPEHHRAPYPEDRMEKQHNGKAEEANAYYQNANSKAEEVNAYYQNAKKDYQEYKKKLAEIEKDYEGKRNERNMHEKPKKSNNNKKDYVTGVLVSIPRIKNHEGLDGGYYKNTKHQNAFLQHLLKTDEEDEQPNRPPTPEDHEKAYLY